MVVVVLWICCQERLLKLGMTVSCQKMELLLMSTMSTARVCSIKEQLCQTNIRQLHPHLYIHIHWSWNVTYISSLQCTSNLAKLNKLIVSHQLINPGQVSFLLWQAHVKLVDFEILGRSLDVPHNSSSVVTRGLVEFSKNCVRTSSHSVTNEGSTKCPVLPR